jgi:hypothetical protein
MRVAIKSRHSPQYNGELGYVMKVETGLYKDGTPYQVAHVTLYRLAGLRISIRFLLEELVEQ